MAWVVGLKAANYHCGPLPDAPERYLGGIEYPYQTEDGDWPPPEVRIVDTVAQAQQFATEDEAQWACADFGEAMRAARLHHDTGYSAYPVMVR